MDGKKVMGPKVSFLPFWAFLTPFQPLGEQREFSLKKTRCCAHLRIGVQLVAKFQKKVMDGYPGIIRTNGRTNGRTDERH